MPPIMLLLVLNHYKDIIVPKEMLLMESCLVANIMDSVSFDSIVAHVLEDWSHETNEVMGKEPLLLKVDDVNELRDHIMENELPLRYLHERKVVDFVLNGDDDVVEDLVVVTVFRIDVVVVHLSYFNFDAVVVALIDYESVAQQRKKTTEEPLLQIDYTIVNWLFLRMGKTFDVQLPKRDYLLILASKEIEDQDDG